ncbi:MAG: UDP-N-acetylmuramate dehydrogenase [Acidobacteriota bacterium]
MIVEHDVPLAPKTTLGLGGPARRLVRVTSTAELPDALALSDDILVLGGGSNLVIGDAGWPGVVLEIALRGVSIDCHSVSVAAGVVWDDLVAQMVRAGRAGVECLSGIPGLVGATPMQNVGAYGQEVSDTITSVRAYDRERREFVTMTPAECRFGYRTSVFRGSARWIVVDVTFALPRGERSAPIRYAELARALGVQEGERAPLQQVRDTVLALRRGKGMVVDPADPDSRSAGSFFTNPLVDAATAARVGGPQWPQPDGRVKLSAGWLIERAGFAKGTTRGRVGISSKHALALVNRGGATASELLALAREIADGVRARLGVELSPEPVIVQ